MDLSPEVSVGGPTPEERLDWICEAMREQGVSEAIIERVRRLNPDPTPGVRPRGWHPTETINRSRLMRDVVSRKKFDARWGKSAHRQLCRHAFLNGGGRRRWISGEAYAEGPEHYCRCGPFSINDNS